MYVDIWSNMMLERYNNNKEKYFKHYIVVNIFAVLIIITVFSLLIGSVNTFKFENGIFSVSVAFLGTILAIFFTLIALPLKNILGKYSNELVNRVFNDKIFHNCLYFFMSVFIYDFALLTLFNIFPANYISNNWIYFLYMWSFSGTVLSIFVLFIFIKRIFYLMDFRNQVKEIIFEIKENFSDSNKKNENKKKLDLIFDIIHQKSSENSFYHEITNYSIKKIGEISLLYIQKFPEIQPKDEYINMDEFMNKVTRGFRDISESQKMDIRLIKSLIEIIDDILKQTIKPASKHDKSFEMITANFVEILGKIASRDDLIKNSQSTSAESIKLICKVCSESFEMYARTIFHTTIMIFKQLTLKLESPECVGLRKIINECGANLLTLLIKHIRPTDKQNLQALIEFIDDRIKFSLEAPEYHYSFYSEDIRHFFSNRSKNNLADIIEKSINKITQQGILIKVIQDILTNYADYIKISIDSEKKISTYPNISSILVSANKIALILIYHIKENKLEQSLNLKLSEYLSNEILNVFSILIKYSIENYEEMQYNFDDYLIIFINILELMIYFDGNHIFDKMIERWVITLLNFSCIIEKPQSLDDSKINALSKLYPYYNQLGSMIFNRMKNEYLNNEIKDVIFRLDNSNILLSEKSLFPQFWKKFELGELSEDLKKAVERTYDSSEIDDYIDFLDQKKKKNN